MPRPGRYSRAYIERQGAMRSATSGLTTEELQKLNPDLVRAAPDLYEALKIAVEWLQTDGHDQNVAWRKALKQALAKAEDRKETRCQD